MSKAGHNLSYAFQPFKLTKIDYKCYDGLFDRGINVYPKPRSGHRIACNNSDIFCFGGFNPATARVEANMLFQELWRFDLFTKKWKLLFGNRNGGDVLPLELASNALVMLNDMIVVYGGTGYPFGQTCSNKTHFIQPYKNPKSVTLLETTGDAPSPQYGQSMVVLGRYVYVIGGTSGFDYSCDVHRLDLQTKVWECINYSRAENEDDPKGRYRHEIVHDDENIYVLGGGTTNRVFSLSSLPAFSLATHKWRRVRTKPDPLAAIPGYPGPRRCHSCVQYRTTDGDYEVAITGGFFDDLNFYNDVWVLNLSTLQWRLFQTARLPHPMYFHDAATSGNGLMYIFGGIEAQDSGATRTNNIYKIWVTIPKLSEICWEAMLTMHPQLPLYPANGLRRVGIPDSFVQRLNRSSEHT